jgi:hypothetical protein
LVSDCLQLAKENKKAETRDPNPPLIFKVLGARIAHLGVFVPILNLINMPPQVVVKVTYNSELRRVSFVNAQAFTYSRLHTEVHTRFYSFISLGGAVHLTAIFVALRMRDRPAQSPIIP